MIIYRHFCGIQFLATLCAVSAWCAEVRLFQTNGRPVGQYEQLIKNLRENDTIVFSDESRKILGKLMGCGGTTCVFELADNPDQVIRIPAHVGYLGDDAQPIPHYIDRFKNGKPELDKRQIPSVSIREYRSEEYLVVDRLHAKTRLDQFLANPFAFPQPERERMTQYLYDFARKTAGLSKIGDFKADQLFFIKDRGWVLFDWTDDHRRISENQNAFDSMFDDSNSPIHKMYRELSSARGFWLKRLRFQLNQTIDQARGLGILKRCSTLFGLVR